MQEIRVYKLVMFLLSLVIRHQICIHNFEIHKCCNACAIKIEQQNSPLTFLPPFGFWSLTMRLLIVVVVVVVVWNLKADEKFNVIKSHLLTLFKLNGNFNYTN